MKRLLPVALAVCILSSCGVQSLYYWGGTSGGVTGYENLAYKDYKLQTPEMICKLVCMYEDMVRNPGGTRHMPPPGICAEYGYLLLMPHPVHTLRYVHRTGCASVELFPLADSHAAGLLHIDAGCKELVRKTVQHLAVMHEKVDIHSCGSNADCLMRPDLPAYENHAILQNV